MKFNRTLIAISALSLSALFTACDDDGSSASASEPKCGVKDGVVVISPAAGDVFKVGESITVVYGSDLAAGGFIFEYRVNADEVGVSLLEESAGPEKGDGSTCYEQKLTLSADLVEPAENAVIRVIPYVGQSKGANSASFTVKAAE